MTPGEQMEAISDEIKLIRGQQISEENKLNELSERLTEKTEKILKQSLKDLRKEIKNK